MHSEFANELRINYACKLLRQNNLSMLDVHIESGYNNISYFNRQFKLQMAVSPRKYQQVFECGAKDAG